jgi:hypothetical protein
MTATEVTAPLMAVNVMKLISLLGPPKCQMSVQNVTFKTVQVKNGAELFWREEKRTKKIGKEN